MAKKIWFDVVIECIKYNPDSVLQVGEVDTLARVKSKGLAFIVACELQEFYGECFKVTIK